MIPGIILAAGMSKRMGTPKQLLDYRGETFLDRLYSQFKQSTLDRTLVVLGHSANRIRNAVDIADDDVVINADYRNGMLSSIQKGVLKAIEMRADAILVCPVDHPSIDYYLIDHLLLHWRKCDRRILLPEFEGRRGHPIIFGNAVFHELLKADPSIGARQVVRADPYRVAIVKVETPNILKDIDTPEEYQEMRREDQV